MPMRETRSNWRDHSHYAGLIESEDGDWLALIRIPPTRGQRMQLVIQPFDRRQVVSITRLDAGRRRRGTADTGVPQPRRD